MTSEDELSVCFALQCNTPLQVTLIAEGISAVGHMLLFSSSMPFFEVRRVKIGPSVWLLVSASVWCQSLLSCPSSQDAVYMLIEKLSE